MKALISPLETVSHIVSWELNPNWDGKELRNKYLSVYAVLPNAERVCEVVQNEFPVAEPLFWIDCADDVDPNLFYYDTVTQTIKLIDNAPYPTQE